MARVRVVGKGEDRVAVRRFTLDLREDLFDRLEQARYKLKRPKAQIVEEALEKHLAEHGIK